MANSVDLVIRIATQAKDSAKALDDVAGNVDGFAGKMEKMAVPAAIAGAAIAGFGKQAFDAASSLQQAMGATDTVFQGNAAQVKEWAAGAASSVGLAESSYLGLANTVGAQLGNAGLATDEAASKTNDLIGMGADLAATFGGDTASAVAALSSALKGEADPAEKYGLNLSAAAVAAKMAADGTDKLTGEAKTAAKAQAIMALATEQSAKSAGQFAREADTAEGATQRSKAAWENAAAAIGTALLPAVTTLAEILGDVAKWAQENATLVGVLLGVFGGLAVAILAVNAALKIAAIAQAAFNLVMSANPIMIVVLAVAALVAGIILLWNNCEGFRNAVIAIWNAIASAAAAAWAGIQAAIGAVISWITGIVTGAGNIITAVWNAIKSAAETVWNAIKSTVSTVATAVSNFVSAIVGPIAGFWDSIKSAADTAWNAIKSTVDSVVSGIKGFIDGLVSTVTGVWDTIQSTGEALWGPIGDAASAVFDTILGIIDNVTGAIGGITSAIQGALDWVGNLWDKIINTPSPPTVPGGVSATGFAGVTSPSLGRRGVMPQTGTTSTASSSGAVTIVVNGVTDSDSAARTIQAMLRRRERRAGVVVAGMAGLAPL